MLRALAVRAQRPVSGAALAVYRVLWSLVLAYECLTYLARPKKLAKLSTTSFHFPFWGFEWIPILSVECTQTRLTDLTPMRCRGAPPDADPLGVRALHGCGYSGAPLLR